MNMQVTEAETGAAVPASDQTTQMALILRLSGETFGISVNMVNEIIDPIHVTRVPNAPAFAPGLINVRGAVVPLLDLRHRLRMAPAPMGGTARIVVVEVRLQQTPTRLAFMADAVEDVVDIDLTRLEPVPDMGAPWPDVFLLGVTRHAKGLVVVLNGDTLFQPEPNRSTV